LGAAVVDAGAVGFFFVVVSAFAGVVVSALGAVSAGLLVSAAGAVVDVDDAAAPVPGEAGSAAFAEHDD
jgi:hypothetical protein